MADMTNGKGRVANGERRCYSLFTTYYSPFAQLRRAADLAAARRRHRHSVGRIFVELVAQRADRDAEDVGGVRAVAETVLERLQNEITLDVSDGATDQRPRHLL